MSASQWIHVRGQTFTVEEAGEASNFGEVLRNCGMDPEESYDMFKDDVLSLGKRLYFAEKVSFDKATLMLLLDGDERIRGVVDARIREHREQGNGGIIC
jgi:hypothetical protein